MIYKIVWMNIINDIMTKMNKELTRKVKDDNFFLKFRIFKILFRTLGLIIIFFKKKLK